MQNVGLKRLHAGLLAGLAAALVGGQALAAADNSGAPCFLISRWHGWTAPNPNTLYLRVYPHDVYRVDLGAAAPQLQWASAQVVAQQRGSYSICSPVDLQLSVSDNGFRQPLIAKALTKLTPEEIAAIPKEYRPN
jgi:hypothetical protein